MNIRNDRNQAAVPTLDINHMLREIPEEQRTIRNRILSIQDLRKFVVLGRTGRGKTTLGNFLVGNFIRPIDLGLGLLGLDGGIGIGHHAVSETTLPNFFNAPERRIAVIDCPGFDDMRSIMHEVKNAFYIQTLFNETSSLRGFFLVLIVLDTDMSPQGRAEGLRELVRHFIALIDSLTEDVLRNTVLIVSCAKSNPDEYAQQMEHFLHDLRAHPERCSDQNVREKTINIFDHFTDASNIVTFPAPVGLDQEYAPSTYEELMQWSETKTSIPQITTSIVVKDSVRIEIMALHDSLKNLISEEEISMIRQVTEEFERHWADDANDWLTYKRFMEQCKALLQAIGEVSTDIAVDVNEKQDYIPNIHSLDDYINVDLRILNKIHIFCRTVLLLAGVNINDTNKNKIADYIDQLRQCAYIARIEVSPNLIEYDAFKNSLNTFDTFVKEKQAGYIFNFFNLINQRNEILLREALSIIDEYLSRSLIFDDVLKRYLVLDTLYTSIKKVKIQSDTTVKIKDFFKYLTSSLSFCHFSKSQFERLTEFLSDHIEDRDLISELTRQRNNHGEIYLHFSNIEKIKNILIQMEINSLAEKMENINFYTFLEDVYLGMNRPIVRSLLDYFTNIQEIINIHNDENYSRYLLQEVNHGECVMNFDRHIEGVRERFHQTLSNLITESLTLARASVEKVLGIYCGLYNSYHMSEDSEIGRIISDVKKCHDFFLNIKSDYINRNIVVDSIIKGINLVVNHVEDPGVLTTNENINNIGYIIAIFEKMKDQQVLDDDHKRTILNEYNKMFQIFRSILRLGEIPAFCEGKIPMEGTEGMLNSLFALSANTTYGNLLTRYNAYLINNMSASARRFWEELFPRLDIHNDHHTKFISSLYQPADAQTESEYLDNFIICYNQAITNDHNLALYKQQYDAALSFSREYFQDVVISKANFVINNTPEYHIIDKVLNNRSIYFDLFCKKIYFLRAVHVCIVKSIEEKDVNELTNIQRRMRDRQISEKDFKFLSDVYGLLNPTASTILCLFKQKVSGHKNSFVQSSKNHASTVLAEINLSLDQLWKDINDFFVNDRDVIYNMFVYAEATAKDGEKYYHHLSGYVNEFNKYRDTQNDLRVKIILERIIGKLSVANDMLTGLERFYRTHAFAELDNQPFKKNIENGFFKKIEDYKKNNRPQPPKPKPDPQPPEPDPQPPEPDPQPLDFGCIPFFSRRSQPLGSNTKTRVKSKGK